MRFDVQHPTADPAWSPEILTPEAVGRFARAAEESGFAGLGFTDHPAPTAKWVRAGGEGSVDPFSALGFCAAVTSTIRLFTWVLVLPYRNPFLAAHQLVSLDALSGGRLTVGLGTGYLRGEFRALGADFDRRRDDFAEALDVLRAVWSQREVTRAGSSYDAREVHPQPRPVQPAPPLWLHGNSRWGRERAARHGDGWIGILAHDPLARTMRTAAMPDLGALERGIAELRALTERAGRDPDAVEVIVSGNWPLLDVRRGWDAERLLAEVTALDGLGVDRVVVIVCGDDAGAAEETVRRFGAEVIAGA